MVDFDDWEQFPTTPDIKGHIKQLEKQGFKFTIDKLRKEHFLFIRYKRSFVPVTSTLWQCAKTEIILELISNACSKLKFQVDNNARLRNS